MTNHVTYFCDRLTEPAYCQLYVRLLLVFLDTIEYRDSPEKIDARNGSATTTSSRMVQTNNMAI